MEIVIIILLIICVIWLAMKVGIASQDEAALANAWRVVRSDPNYKERRPFEERKHTAEEQALTLGEAARETSQSRAARKSG